MTGLAFICRIAELPTCCMSFAVDPKIFRSRLIVSTAFVSHSGSWSASSANPRFSPNIISLTSATASMNITFMTTESLLSLYIMFSGAAIAKNVELYKTHVKLIISYLAYAESLRNRNLLRTRYDKNHCNNRLWRAQRDSLTVFGIDLMCLCQGHSKSHLLAFGLWLGLSPSIADFHRRERAHAARTNEEAPASFQTARASSSV